MRRAGRELGAGFATQLRRLLFRPRYVVMMALLVGMSWLAVDVYGHLVLYGLPVAIVDHDNSKISRTLREFIAADRMIRLVDDAPATLAEAEERLAKGELAGYLYLPHEMSTKIKKSKRAEVLIAVDMSNIVIGKNLHKVLARLTTTVAAGAQLTVVKKLGLQKEQAMARVMPINVISVASFNPAANYGAYLMPVMIFFFLHVYTLICSLSLFLQLHRPETRAALIGSFGAVLLVATVVGLVFAYVFLPIEHIPPESGFGLVLVNLVAFLTLDILFAVAFNAVIPIPMVAFEATVIIGMLSLMFSGVTYPTSAFPLLIRLFATIIPFTPFALGSRMFLNMPMTFGEMAPIFAHYGWQALGLTLVAVAGYGVRGLWARHKRPVEEAA